MVGIGRLIILSLMTSVTGRWGISEPVGMAFGAGYRSMCASQRERRGRMVENRIQPVIRIVAHFTIGWIRLSLMVRSTIVLGLVTA
jgi:hypothetical protein